MGPRHDWTVTLTHLDHDQCLWACTRTLFFFVVPVYMLCVCEDVKREGERKGEFSCASRSDTRTSNVLAECLSLVDFFVLKYCIRLLTSRDFSWRVSFFISSITLPVVVPILAFRISTFVLLPMSFQLRCTKISCVETFEVKCRTCAWCLDCSGCHCIKKCLQFCECFGFVFIRHQKCVLNSMLAQSSRKFLTCWSTQGTFTAMYRSVMASEGTKSHERVIKVRTRNVSIL